MSENMLDLSARKPRRSADLAKRIISLTRSYQKFLRAKPTLLEKATLVKAATLQARSEAIAADPGASVEEITQIERCARVARADLAKIVRARREQVPPPRHEIGRGY
jgi:hypothetical protein